MLHDSGHEATVLSTDPLGLAPPSCARGMARVPPGTYFLTPPPPRIVSVDCVSTNQVKSITHSCQNKRPHGPAYPLPTQPTDRPN